MSLLHTSFVGAKVPASGRYAPARAPGTGHFRVGIGRGRALMRELRRRLSGLALPTYVLDLPGGHAKVPLLSDDVEETAPGHWRIRDHAGVWHEYSDT